MILPALVLVRLGVLSGLDRAITIARERPREVLLPALAGGALVPMVLLTIYYVERVEGVQALRLPLAFFLVLAWWGRALLLGRAARSVASRLGHASEHRPRAADVLRTSLIVGAGFWVWSWLFVLGSLGGIGVVLLVVPFFVLRGAVAPSWIARASCEPEAGLRAFLRAIADNDGRRTAGIGTEALLIAGTVGLGVNVYATSAVALFFARSFGGIEVASLETFLSPDNTFVLLAVGGVAITLMEPVRAAVSAVAYVDARVRADGLDLRALVDRAIEHSSAPAARKLGRAAAIGLAIACLPSAALAQDALSYSSDPGEMPVVEMTPEDRAVDAEVDRILAEPAFREFEDRRGEGLRQLLERLFEWLLDQDEEAPAFDGPDLGAIPLPGAWFFIALAAVLLLVVGAYLWVTSKKDAKRAKVAAATEGFSGDPRERPPSSFLDEAARLAEAGDLREALRALYLATLVALDRRRMIAFDPHLTNWQYLRQMPRGGVRDAFTQFTRLFDHKWYGREETTVADYERCRGLARDIVGEDGAAA